MLSKYIVEQMTASLKTYANTNGVIYENYRVEPSELEERTDIPMARIALYEDSEETLERNNVVKPSMSSQTYLIDVSVVRAYRGDKANRGEFVILDLCDKIKEWVKQVDISVLTLESVYSINYTSASRNLRNNKYVTRTITLIGKRDLYSNQIPAGLQRAFNLLIQADDGTIISDATVAQDLSDPDFADYSMYSGMTAVNTGKLYFYTPLSLPS